MDASASIPTQFYNNPHRIPPHQQLALRNLNNDASKQTTVTGGVNEIFYASTGTVFMTTATAVQLYDLQNQVQLAEIQAPNIKYVHVSNDGGLVALVGKHSMSEWVL